MCIFHSYVYNNKFTYLFFYENKNILPFLKLLKYKNFYFFNSYFLKIFFIFYRHFFFVIDSSRFLNPVFDFNKFSFKKTFIKSKYSLSQNLYKYVIKKINKNFLHDNDINFNFNYIIFHARFVKNDLKNSHRNTSRNYVNKIIKIIKENYKGMIVNIGHVPVDDKQFININHKLLNNEYLNLFKNAQCYIGDASGPTVIAQFIGTNSFLYNIFPFDFKTSNKKSIILYKTLKQNELHLDQNFINLLHYDYQVKKYKISFEDVNINQVKKNLIPFIKDLN